MLSAYPACFFKDRDGYTVVFPDLNWLSTCGETLDDALNMSVDCLAGYLYESKKSGDTVPGPSNFTDVNPQDIAAELEIEPQEAFLNIITVDVEKYAKQNFERSVGRHVSLPVWLNDAAAEKGINFSQTLQEALLAKLGMK